MIDRQALPTLRQRLRRMPAVVLTGPRQSGKTTLARAVAAHHPNALLLDMERESDRAAVAQAELFLPTVRDRLVVVDEVQFAPDFFSALRPEIDADRRPGRFLLLGSASGPLLRQSAESLAGRVAYLELTPFLAAEVASDPAAMQRLWLRGGFPPSFLAEGDDASFEWRQDFLRTFLQRDLPSMGVRVGAEPLRRFWTMLAHLQGQLFNASQLGQSLGGAAHTTTTRWLDLLCDAMMVRQLPPYAANVGKRLVKSPKVYLRDSGLLHALLGIATVEALQGHPVAAASWEGFVVEQVAAALPAAATMSFYRTASGNELDLVIETARSVIAVEIKFSASPKPTRGFWQAIDDVRPDRAVIVAPVARRWPLAEGVEVVGVGDVVGLLRAGAA